MKVLLPVLAAVSVILAPVAVAEACRGPFPKPITQAQAFDGADAVFLARVVSVMDGYPADFVPRDAAAFERRKETARQQKKSLGRTLTFAIERQWKGLPAATVSLVDPTPLNTCEWSRDVQVGDRVIVFAVSAGSALTFPAPKFDPRGDFIRVAPRRDSGAPREVLDRQEREFEAVLRALPKVEQP